MPRLLWSCYFSDDGIDWHPENGFTETSDVLVTHGNDVRLHSWTPSATTSKGQIKYMHTRPCTTETDTQVASNYTRVNFGLTGTFADVWVRLITKQESE